MKHYYLSFVMALVLPFGCDPARGPKPETAAKTPLLASGPILCPDVTCAPSCDPAAARPCARVS